MAQYAQKVYFSVIRLQRWFRAQQQKMFFKHLLKKERQRQRQLLKEQLFDMEVTVQRMERDYEEKRRN